jgi:hypothetical protein
MKASSIVLEIGRIIDNARELNKPYSYIFIVANAASNPDDPTGGAYYLDFCIKWISN